MPKKITRHDAQATRDVEGAYTLVMASGRDLQIDARVQPHGTSLQFAGTRPNFPAELAEVDAKNSLQTNWTTAHNSGGDVAKANKPGERACS